MRITSINAFPYERAPWGSADNYWTTHPVDIFWSKIPDRFSALVIMSVTCADGAISLEIGPDHEPRLRLRLETHFCFDVSVAPSEPDAMPGAAAHDWIYSHADGLADAWCCSVRDVLELADHLFLALMRYTEFKWSKEYFLGVSLFGYAFNRVNHWLHNLWSKP